jgi:hypothetical protein
MRTASTLIILALVGVAVAQPGGYAHPEGKYRAGFPNTPKLSEQVTKSAVGDLKVNIASYATSDGNVYMVSYTDFPAAATKPENHATLYAGIRDGVKGSNGQVSDEKDRTFGADKLPGREFTVTKDKVRMKFRVVLRDSRLYQVAVIGTADFVKTKDATAFLDAFDFTK